MQYRRFGRTNLQMPVFSCGGMRYQFQWQDVPMSQIPDENQGNLEAIIENLGLKPRRSTTALPSNISAFTRYMLECEIWKKPTRSDFTPHQNKSRYCGALWAV
jgi:hypothetical protein